MKKILSCLLAFCMLFIFIPNISETTYALEISIDPKIEKIIEHQNVTFTKKQLRETKFKNDTVQIIDNQFYVNNTRSAGVTIFIAGILAGYLIDGAIIYATGYSGGQLTANAISSLKSAWNSYRNMTTAYFSSYNSYLNSFTTSNGNECYRSGSKYVCKYSTTPENPVN